MNHPLRRPLLRPLRRPLHASRAPLKGAPPADRRNRIRGAGALRASCVAGGAQHSGAAA